MIITPEFANGLSRNTAVSIGIRGEERPLADVGHVHILAKVDASVSEGSELNREEIFELCLRDSRNTYA